MNYRIIIGGLVTFGVFNAAITPEEFREEVGDPPPEAMGSIFSTGSSAAQTIVFNAVEGADYDATPLRYHAAAPSGWDRGNVSHDGYGGQRLDTD